MPLYEYECKRCHTHFEEFQSMKDAPLKDCMVQECGGTMERLISSTHIGLCDTHMLRDAYKTRESFDDPHDQKRTEIYRKKAEAAGVSTTGKWYHPGLAVELGDPMAWVGSISDIKDVCKMRGWDVTYSEGELKIKHNVDMSKTLKEQYGTV